MSSEAHAFPTVRRRAFSDWLTSVFTPRTLLLTGVLITINALFIRAVQDPDFWWHVKTGQWMVQHLALPSHDLYTFTVPSHVWTDHEYLVEAVMWLVWSSFGWAPLITGFAAITWLGFWLIYRTSEGHRRPYVIVALGIVVGALAGAPIWGPRSQMITFTLSCLELYWLRSYLDGRSRTINWFPLVMLLWANVHAGWVIGFAFLGIAILSEAIPLAFDRTSLVHRARVKRLGIIFTISAAAVAATPHGLGLYLYPFHTQGSPAQQNLINEWASPNFHFTEMHFYEAMIVLLLVGFALRRPSLYEILLSVAVLVLSLQSVRHVALFIAAMTPILIVTWSDVYERFADRKPRWLSGDARPSALFAAVAALALVAIGGATIAKVHSDLARQDSVTRAQFPVGAADYLAAHPSLGTRMYNQYGWGGYLAYRFYPERNRRVFIFGEGDLMGDSMLTQYEDVQVLQPDWNAVLDRYHVDYVVYNHGWALDNVLATQPGWVKVYSDDVAVIYVRKSALKASS